MGLLQPFVDMTGEMTGLQITERNISQIINEVNRNADQLDSLNNSLNIIGRGSASLFWDGTGETAVTVNKNHGFNFAPVFLGFFVRSDQPDLSYPVPMWFYDNSGNFLNRIYGYTDSTNINFQFATAVSGSPLTFTFSWYIIQQPAQVPTGN